MDFAFENRITVRISQSARLAIDIVLYKALLHSNQFTQWLGKHWGRGEGLTTALDLQKPPVNDLRG
jgi:hypothetical protein